MLKVYREADKQTDRRRTCDQNTYVGKQAGNINFDIMKVVINIGHSKMQIVTALGDVYGSDKYKH